MNLVKDIEAERTDPARPQELVTMTDIFACSLFSF